MSVLQYLYFNHFVCFLYSASLQALVMYGLFITLSTQTLFSGIYFSNNFTVLSTRKGHDRFKSNPFSSDDQSILVNFDDIDK